MAKFRPRDSEDDDTPVPEGTARSTLQIARFFFDRAKQLDRREHIDIEAYENFVMAAIVFACSALWNLKGEFASWQKQRKRKEEKKKNEKEAFEKWFEDHMTHLLIAHLMTTRHKLLHRRPISRGYSAQDMLYLADEPSPQIREEYGRLPEQLNKVEAIIKEFEEKYR